MGKFVRMLLPLGTVEFENPQICGHLIQAIDVHVDAIRIRAWGIERLDPTDTAKRVAGNTGIEVVGRERVVSLYQPEPAQRYDEMQKPAFAADGAIAAIHFQVGRRFNLEPDPAAMTAASVLHDASFNSSSIPGICA
jgi:hypothetical protein